ncbi:MAG: hypothetical protein OXH82_02390, partial [Candidatus Dadabacteria bacterium]|nr:hypothetical protein [Candidatus Dadabacteria bacterium]MDE0662764.1 hypothetical protein [Candidatus Dadabacteria bacterium]
SRNYGKSLKNRACSVPAHARACNSSYLQHECAEVRISSGKIRNPVPKTSRFLFYEICGLGFSEACRDFYYGWLLPLVRESGFEVLDPWDASIESPAPETEKDIWDRFNMLTGERNREMIESGDGILAVIIFRAFLVIEPG